MPSSPPCCSTDDPGLISARLEFAVAAGRTCLVRQHVPYPFHVTRPFHLDEDRPDLATLYLQSSSGGLYSGEHLSLTVEAGVGAAVSVTTQAATAVRDGKGRAATVETNLRLSAASVLMHMPDPLILFPDAVARSIVTVTLPDDAVAVCCDGFWSHDPHGLGRTFASWDSELVVQTPNGRILVAERGTVNGNELGTPQSPLGPFRAGGMVVLLNVTLHDFAALQKQLSGLGCISGASPLPNGAGQALRILAHDGGALASGLAAASSACFEAATGVRPAPRRK